MLLKWALCWGKYLVSLLSISGCRPDDRGYNNTFLNYCRVDGKRIRASILGTECLWFKKIQREPTLKLFKNGLFLEGVCAVHSPERGSNIKCVVWNVFSVSGLDMLGYMLVVILCNLSQTSVVWLLTGKWPFLPALRISTVTALTLQNKDDLLVWP